ncbi:MAG: amidohydrolase [Lachnospiraceae bacterium]|nr:amidohydrolase [Lachnospiraceae bacterium]
MKDYSAILTAIENGKEKILAAERFIWKHPETGYREWKTHRYLKGLFEELGYTLTEFGNIPGFYTDLDSGKPGPCLAVFGELDALIVPTHPECDPETGAVHACGHNCQAAALYGLAVGLKAPGALDGLSGKIRLIAVPAEELIELEYRQQLKDQGIIRFFGGKQELMARGILDGADLCMMIHMADGRGYKSAPGSNGCIIKQFTFTGKAAHAGGSPDDGINALYAANAALNAANALRETFRDTDHVRFHPILTAGGSAVNSIPDCVTIEAYVRAATLDAILLYNEKINRAFAAAAASIGCGLVIQDLHGYAPYYRDPLFAKVALEAAKDLLGEDRVDNNRPFGTGCSDIGDVSSVMPAIHPNIGGYSGTEHGNDLYITDPYLATVVSAKIQAETAVRLLENDAEKAKAVIAQKHTAFASISEYLEAVEKLSFTAQAVIYEENGEIRLHYKNNA